MKVLINGLENSVHTEELREIVAKTLSREWNVRRIQPNIQEIIVDCAPSSTRKRDNNSNEKSATFDHLVSEPKKHSSILVLPPEQQDLFDAQLERWKLIPLVHGEWGLYSIDPSPRLSLNFVGPSGTGKTLAAHNFAAKLNKKIIEVSYADVVSKYFGEAAKNLSALFAFAGKNDAVLFIDEAETLLSRRSATSNDGADHAVNSMRSQLLILIQNTPTISIFASNLVEGYDPAFLTRLTTIKFPPPNEEVSELIWAAHIPEKLPLDVTITPKYLANEFQGLTGRQISQVIIQAAYRAAGRAQNTKKLTPEDFLWAHNLVRSTGE